LNKKNNKMVDEAAIKNQSSSTKIVYYRDEQETPYIVSVNVSPDQITLKDFKDAFIGLIQKRNYKFFFRAIDQEFGTVKEEILDDGVKLPVINGRAIAYLISKEGSIGGVSDNSRSHSQTSLNNVDVIQQQNTELVSTDDQMLQDDQSEETPHVIGGRIMPSKVVHHHHRNNHQTASIEHARAALNSLDNHIIHKPSLKGRQQHDVVLYESSTYNHHNNNRKSSVSTKQQNRHFDFDNDNDTTTETESAPATITPTPSNDSPASKEPKF
jgi:hypothetical protein